jgi:hypothetical protein
VFAFCILPPLYCYVLESCPFHVTSLGDKTYRHTVDIGHCSFAMCRMFPPSHRDRTMWINWASSPHDMDQVRPTGLMDESRIGGQLRDCKTKSVATTRDESAGFLTLERLDCYRLIVSQHTSLRLHQGFNGKSQPDSSVWIRSSSHDVVAVSIVVETNGIETSTVWTQHEPRVENAKQ